MMCLLALFYKTIPGYPLVLAANRDEYYDRPASPPLLWEWPDGVPFLAPRDEQAGGTWLGINADGGIAALTNRKVAAQDPTASSRGTLCAGALAAGCAESMVRFSLEAAGGSRLNGFNLVLADRSHAWLLQGGGDSLRCEAIPPGAHFLTNEHGLDEARPFPEPWWSEAPASEEALIENLRRSLQAHEPLGGSGFSPCKHFERRGTRSAAVLIVGEGGVRFLFADGAPCRTPFEDFTSQAKALMRLGHPGEAE